MTAMRKIIGLTLFALFLVAGTVESYAQQFGYVNSSAILEELEEVKSMRSELEALQTQLEKKGQTMLTAYQKKEQDAVRKAERGEMSPVEQESIGKELQAEQEKIRAFRQNIQTRLASKQEELLNPILERINSAISDVAT